MAIARRSVSFTWAPDDNIRLGRRSYDAEISGRGRAEPAQPIAERRQRNRMAIIGRIKAGLFGARARHTFTFEAIIEKKKKAGLCRL